MKQIDNRQKPNVQARSVVDRTSFGKGKKPIKDFDEHHRGRVYKKKEEGLNKQKEEGEDKNVSRIQPVHSAPKIGRNDPCPCGSGLKYKKCCLLKNNESTKRKSRRI